MVLKHDGIIMAKDIIEFPEGTDGFDLTDKSEKITDTEIFFDKADDSVVHVDVDGKSYQHAGSGKNLFDIRHHRYSATITPNEWGGFDRSGGYGGITGSEIKVEPNQTYTFSYKVDYGTARQEIYDGDGSILYILGTDTNVSFTPKHSTIRIDMSHWSGANYIDSRITEIQLEKGSVATEYEPPAPTPDYPIEIHSLNDFDVVSSVGGRNYFNDTMREYDKGAILSYGNNPISTELIEGSNFNYFRVKKTASTSLQMSLYNTINLGNIAELSGLVGREVTISLYMKSNYNRSIQFRFNSLGDSVNTFFNEEITTQWRQVSRTFIVTEKTNTLRFTPYSITLRDATEALDFHMDIGGYKLEKGNKATDWTPAPEDITESDNHPLIDKINLSLSQPLRSVGDVKDRLFRDSDGLWKIERNVSETTFGKNLKPSTTHTIEDNPNIIVYFIGAVYQKLSMNLHENTNLMASNYFSYYPGPQLQNTTKVGVIARNNSSGLRAHNVYFFVEKKDFPDLQSFNIWLEEMEINGKPVKIVGEAHNVSLETLNQELQDKLNNLRSFQDSNYVYTIINDKTDNISENLKPTLHARFKSEDYGILNNNYGINYPDKITYLGTYFKHGDLVTQEFIESED